MEGQERRAIRLWQNLAGSECRLGLFKELGNLNVGVADIEEFNLGILSKLRSEKLRGEGEKATKKLIKSAMEIKIRDEDNYREEKVRKRHLMRREIGEHLKVNSRPYRNLMRNLRECAEKVREDYRVKYETKIKHLKEKYRENEEEKISKIPDLLKEYDGLSIFDPGKFEAIEIEQGDILWCRVKYCQIHSMYLWNIGYPSRLDDGQLLLQN